MFIVFEGPDGVGKTTQALMLATALRASGYTCVLTREPTDSPAGQRALEYARQGDQAAAFDAFLEDRAEHVKSVILPALSAGHIVVCDRYVLSTLVYQPDVAPPDLLAKMAAMRPKQPLPDMCIVLDMPLQLLKRRIRRREKDQGHDERGGGDLNADIKARSERYRRLASHYSDWCWRVSAPGLSKHQVHERVCRAVVNVLMLRNLRPVTPDAAGSDT